MYFLSKRVCVFLKKSINHICSYKGVSTHGSSLSPLDGVKILDLTRVVAGPYCTMILGDMGAEVIKVERPGVGDESRNWGPPYVGNSKETCYFVAVNRNKKSICVDLKTDLGRKLIYDLSVECDVLVENYIPGKLDELQLGYDHIKGVAPHLIYCSITGYGSIGPYSNRPGYDVIASSVGGLLHITGTEDGEPTKPGVAVMDIASGLYAHGAILAALIKRGRTGLGQKIDCNLLATTVSSLINIGSDYLNAGKEAKRWGTAHATLVPYQTFITKDGYYTIGAASNGQFADFCHKIGLPHLSKDKKFLNNQNRVTNRNDLITLLEPIFKTKTNKQWGNAFQNAQFPCGPVNSLKEVFTDPQVAALGLVQNMEHKTAKNLKVVGPPVIYSDGGNFIRSPPPSLGEHTNDVLKNILGYKEDKIKHLRECKVIE